MEYAAFDPDAYRFPRPRIPVLPWLTLDALTIRASEPGNTLPIQARARCYQRARYALTEALRLCGVGPDSAILIPAYHCRSMLDPAIRLGAEISLYSAGFDLKPDLENITNCVAACSRPARALLLTHYFGIPQDVGALKQLCDRLGLALIEDCSHCLPAAPVTDTIGTIGRFSVWSPYKFFPSDDGGMLVPVAGTQLPPTTLCAPALRNEIKAIARGIQRSRERAELPAPETPVAQLQGLSDEPARAASDRQVSSKTTSDYYDAAVEQMAGLASTRWIIRHSNIRRLIDQRRANFALWTRAVADLPNCRALVSHLPPHCVPYMFPLYITRTDTDFPALKQLGLPIWRWDELAVSDCRVAADYRLHLLHLPCHQELTDAQMTWMISVLGKVLHMSSMTGQMS